MQKTLSREKPESIKDAAPANPGRKSHLARKIRRFKIRPEDGFTKLNRKTGKWEY